MLDAFIIEEIKKREREHDSQCLGSGERACTNFTSFCSR